MSKVRILSPRPEINKNTAVDAVFLFIWWGCGFERQIKIYQGSNVSLARHGVSAACILVFIRTALGLVLIYSDSLVRRINAP